MQRVLDPRVFGLLQGVPDVLLEKMELDVERVSYRKDEVVYEKDSPATHFGFFLSGRGMMQLALNEEASLSLGLIKPGYCIGFGALNEDGHHGRTLICLEDSEVARIEAKRLQEVLEADPTAAFPFMRNIALLLRDRLELRTDQLVKTFASHPFLGSAPLPKGDFPHVT